MIILNKEAVERIKEWREPSDGSHALGYKKIARILGSDGNDVRTDTIKIKNLCKALGLGGLRGYVPEKVARVRKSSSVGSILVCALCGGEFMKEKSGPNPKCCSYTCRQTYSHRLRDYICEFCEREFQSRSRNARYCSLSCSSKSKMRKEYEERRKDVPDDYEICNACGGVLLLDDFYPLPGNVNRKVSSECRSCSADRWIRYASESDVLERKRTARKPRTREEKDLKNKRQNKVRNLRTRTDPAYKLNERVRGAIYDCLRGTKNGRHWEALVGWTLEDLKAHLESLFGPGMSWDNYGHDGWTIDHTIPISWFNFTSPDDPEFKQCWSLDNLKPMWEMDNISKQATYAG